MSYTRTHASAMSPPTVRSWRWWQQEKAHRAKHRDRRPGMAELRSLEHARDLLIAAGHDASAATICLFSGTGFTDDLAAEAARSHARILLVGLEFLYGIQHRLG
jgi:hypothetical protein